MDAVNSCLDGNKDMKRIALQFPDEMLSGSNTIFLSLQKKFPDREFFILADTSYGSCCVDELAADHVCADLVIHFGHSCLSQPSKFKTLWVFEDKMIDLTAVESCLSSVATLTLLFYDVNFAQCLQTFESKNQNIIKSNILTESKTIEGGLYGRYFDCDLPSKFQIIWIGSEDSPTFFRILLGEQSKSTTVLRYDPDTQQLHENHTNSRLFQRRLFFINKVKQFETFSLLVASISDRNILEMIKRVQNLLKSHSKVFYTTIIGKLNPNKLANFLEVDCFVWLGCPENQIIYDLDLYREYHKPIITPIEVVLGFGDSP